MERSVLLLFGPQQSTIRPEALTRLASTILNNPNLGFLLEVLDDLEDLWSDILEACPYLTRIAGRETLSQLRLFFRARSDAADLIECPAKNIVLSVITVISQVVDLWRHASTDVRLASIPASRSMKGSASVKDVQGFCIGFLTAAAVASSTTQEALERNITVALRLAVCIGAIVELDNVLASPAVSVSIGWKSETQYEKLERVLQGTHDGYISCVTDERRVTVTLQAQDLINALHQFSNAGLPSHTIPLQGRFHRHSIHANIVQQVQQLCQQDERFQLAKANELVLPLRSNIDADLISAGSLHDEALRSILLQQCQWYRTVHAAVATLDGGLDSIISVGSEMAIPRSILELERAKKLPLQNGIGNHTIINGQSAVPQANHTSEVTTAIAIIGMACRYPDSDTLDDFWKLLHSGPSAVQPLPERRFKVSQLQREPKGPFWGNFLRHPDQFDHRFFGISGREAKSMDPQQRLALEVAYEALESAGYFGLSGSGREPISDVGVYLGVGSVDYGDNVASQDANAFSALGTLRAFITGRLSHYFGWSGPSITYDTACSSGLVAIHAAVNALKASECSMALAGGVNVITSPALYQNLAAASFLSPSGASKAFDEGADGYCRGEGAGLLVLKTLAQAQADGDPILAVIRGSAVMQGSNHTPIAVPSSDTQVALYRKALSMSGIEPLKVTYVEAHGTGTPVGDPIECNSIREVFGSHHRKNRLFVGSVKDNVGHTESASGATGMIKTVLMMQKEVLLRQANFTKLNLKIAPLSPDCMEIPQQNQPWIAPRRIAVVNNYGAAGSNAAMVVEQYKTRSTTNQASYLTASGWPFYLSAKSFESLRAYSASLASSLRDIQREHGATATMDLAYNLAGKQNRQFKFVHTFVASDINELARSLDPAKINGQRDALPQSERPVVLCIGGQNGTTVHLDYNFYHSSSLLQTHLDACDRACMELGLPSLFPSILSPESTEDLVKLHCMLFSVQYACAKSWIDSGLKVDTIIGHSFGQLTALVVAASLPLLDGLRLVSERARLIQEAWGHETGAMLSVQASVGTVTRFLEDDEHYPAPTVDIACVNGPEAVVLAGDTTSVSILEQRLQRAGLKTARLPNTHAFHSRLVDPILPRWREIVQSCHFEKPSIRIEACAENQDWSSFVSPEDVIQHSREPVYFHQAVTRVATRLKDSVWVEAGSASPVVSLVRKSLGTNNSGDIFQPLDLRGRDALSAFSRAICNLWAAGTRVQHWCFHQNEYNWINLPPYSFEKTSHWLDYRPPAAIVATSPRDTPSPVVERPRELLELVETGIQGTTYRVDCAHPLFAHCTKGHAVLGQALCPASLYVELATQAAARELQPLKAPTFGGSSVRELRMLSPLSISSHCSVYIRLSQNAHERTAWQFTVLSGEGNGESGSLTTHTTGVISRDSKSSILPATKMHSLRRLVGQVKASSLSSCPDSNIIQGKNIYRTFGQVVSYASYYRGVEQIVSRENESVGRVQLQYGNTPGLNETAVDPVLLDNFLQVAGIHVNCLSDRADEEVYICTELGYLALSDSFISSWREIPAWNVYTTFETRSDRTVSNDILVYDAKSGELMVMFIDATFHSTAMKSLARILAKLNIHTQNAPHSALNGAVNGHPSNVPISPPSVSEFNQVSTSTSINSTIQQVCELLSSVLELPVSEISPSSTLIDIGIDSLLSTEILSEITKRFGIAIPASEFISLDTVSSIAHYLNSSPTSPLANGHAGESAPVMNGTSKSGRVFSQVQEMLGDILEVPIDEIKPTSSLTDIGIDSLLATEVLNEIRTRFAVVIPVDRFQEFDNVKALASYLLQQGTSNEERSEVSSERSIEEAQSTRSLAAVAQESFGTVRQDIDRILPETQFSGFCKSVLPLQKELVAAYLVEAFESLGCSLTALHSGQRIPDITLLTKHHKVKKQIYYILDDAGLIELDSSGHFVRTATAVPQDQAERLHGAILSRFPQHAYEHRLLASTGSKLAACLVGDIDPLGILFGDADARALMEHVYTDAPMFKTGTIQLARYLGDIFRRLGKSRPTIRILELGAGTGGTTKHLVEHLVSVSAGQQFEYTFSDISPSLVAAARKKFAQYKFMQYTIVNIENDPPAELVGQYDIIISTNCIHATKDLVTSCTNIRKLLHPDGILCLVELTRNLFWFDLVFGLLDGWWRFQDGRQHALANEHLWRKYLTQSGFQWVDWTVGESEETDILRVITASPSEPVTYMETIEFDRVDGLSLEADIYYPSNIVAREKSFPVALMIHGGGHIMLSRKDIRPQQTQMLLERGFIPISVDYRLCPETTLPDGPMHDVCTALSWIQTVLPTLPLQRPDIRIDPDHVVAVGWSTGGHLALTLGFMAPQRGIRPPDAILAFYCPLDYEDPFWTRPNFPFGHRPDTSSEAQYNVRSGLFKHPITAYNVPASIRALAGWMAPSNARSQIALLMNQKGRALQVLLNGLSLESDELDSLPMPTISQIRAISPLAQIQNGMYRTPIFIIHGTKDDLIPVDQAVRTHSALKERMITSEVKILNGAVHLFDLGKVKEEWARAVTEGYDFLQTQACARPSDRQCTAQD
ncbi:polyketide synthase [Aspergillus ustus]|uniref:Polyketide synthase n=1 Tax=Aspergillus ustus TaxID=40382 RepID=A0A0C1EG42_ASPUT|nr:polyketide synthase [Aspergillus ustus]